MFSKEEIEIKTVELRPPEQLQLTYNNYAYRIPPKFNTGEKVKVGDHEYKITLISYKSYPYTPNTGNLIIELQLI